MQNETTPPVKSKFFNFLNALSYPFRMFTKSPNTALVDNASTSNAFTDAGREPPLVQIVSEAEAVEPLIEDSIVYLDKVLDAIVQEDQPEVTFSAVRIDSNDTDCAQKVFYRGILSQNNTILTGSRTLETEHAIFTYEGIFNIKIAPEGGMSIGVLRARVEAKLTVQYKVGPNKGMVYEYCGHFQALRQDGLGVVSYLNTNAGIKISRSGLFQGFSILGPCEVEVVSHPEVKTKLTGVFDRDPRDKEIPVRGALDIKNFIDNQWQDYFSQSGVFCGDLLLVGKNLLQLHNVDARSIPCERKTVFKSNTLVFHETGIFEKGVLREGVYYSSKANLVSSCYEGKLNADGLLYDDEGVLCQYSPNVKTLIAVMHLGLMNKNRCWYLIEVQEGELHSITEVMGDGVYRVTGAIELIDAQETPVFFKIHPPSDIKQVLWRLTLDASGKFKCIKPDTGKEMHLDPDILTLWNRVKKLVALMQVREATIPEAINNRFEKKGAKSQLTSVEQKLLIEELLASDKKKGSSKPPKPSPKKTNAGNAQVALHPKTKKTKAPSTTLALAKKPQELAKSPVQLASKMKEEMLSTVEPSFSRNNSFRGMPMSEESPAAVLASGAFAQISTEKKVHFHSVFVRTPADEESESDLLPGEIRRPLIAPPTPVPDWSISPY